MKIYQLCVMLLLNFTVRMVYVVMYVLLPDSHVGLPVAFTDSMYMYRGLSTDGILMNLKIKLAIHNMTL